MCKNCHVQSWQWPQKICSAITQKVLQQSIDRSDLFNFPLSRYFVLFYHTEIQQNTFRFVLDKIWLNSRVWFVLWDSGASPERTMLIPFTAVRYSLFTKQMLHEPLTVKSTVALKGSKHLTFDLSVWGPICRESHNSITWLICLLETIVLTTLSLKALIYLKKGKQCHI